MRKRIVFVTSIRWGKACLVKTIQNKECEVVSIFTTNSPEKAIGYEAMDEIAAAHQIPIYKIDKINYEIDRIKSLRPDWLFVLGFSQILSDELLNIPKDGAIGGHPTMLPKNRGRAPLTWAIIKGLSKTGFTLFHLSENVDEGDIIAQEEIPISPDETVLDLLDKVTYTSAKLLEEVLPDLLAHKEPRIKQDSGKANYWEKRTPKDGIIDWNNTTKELYAWVRALTKPYPGAFSFYKGKKLIIWDAVQSKTKGKPGKILNMSDGYFIVGTKDSSLKVTEFEIAAEHLVKLEVNTYFTDNKVS